jgi:hypothetical protein
MQKTSVSGVTFKLSASPIRITYYRQMPCRVKPIEFLVTQSAAIIRATNAARLGRKRLKAPVESQFGVTAISPGLSSVNDSALSFPRYHSTDLKIYRARPEDR